MKNRKIVVVAFMLVAVMLLGIGFAELTDELVVKGDIATNISASQDAFDDGLYIKSADIILDETGNKAIVAHKDTEKDEVDITAHDFTTEGQKVIVAIVIENQASSDFTAAITPQVGNVVTLDNGEADHDPIFAATWSWSQDEVNVSAVTLNPGETKTFYVTITLTEVPDAVHTATFTIGFNAIGTRYEAQAVQGE